MRFPSSITAVIAALGVSALSNVPAPAAALEKHRSVADPIVSHAKPTSTRSPAALRRVALANRRAVKEPSSSNYVNAAQVYPWEEGSLYRLYAAPGLVSDVALQPGETLISVAAGDTTRWVIGDTTSGAAPDRRTHILVKPSASGLHTNVVITTDRRVYLLMLESTSGAAMPAISWTYPTDDLLAVRRQREVAQTEPSVGAGISVDRLNFNYSIEGDQPAWRPVRAFDDGMQVYIEFPASIGLGEAPPLFIIGESGKAELVNYRVRGRYYVVDRLFFLAELRLGEKHQQIVRILRSDLQKHLRRRD